MGAVRGQPELLCQREKETTVENLGDSALTQEACREIL